MMTRNGYEDGIETTFLKACIITNHIWSLVHSPHNLLDTVLVCFSRKCGTSKYKLEVIIFLYVLLYTSRSNITNRTNQS